MFLFFIALFIFQFGAGPCGCEDKPQVNILAVVNGVKIRKKLLRRETVNSIVRLIIFF
jgi:hypothetical protein